MLKGACLMPATHHKRMHSHATYVAGLLVACCCMCRQPRPQGACCSSCQPRCVQPRTVSAAVDSPSMLPHTLPPRCPCRVQHTTASVVAQVDSASSRLRAPSDTSEPRGQNAFQQVGHQFTALQRLIEGPANKSNSSQDAWSRRLAGCVHPAEHQPQGMCLQAAGHCCWCLC